MKKPAFFVLFSILCINDAVARPVSEDEARQFAQNWVQEKWGRRVDLSVNRAVAAAMPAEKTNSDNLYHVLNIPEGGWMIIAADDVVHPVLAFSPTGSVSGENRPVQFDEWMGDVKKSISAAIAAKQSPPIEAAAAWKRFNVKSESFSPQQVNEQAAGSAAASGEVGPLLSTKWDQGKYYNAACPADTSSPYNGRVPVGCVATAMAQIMNYHMHPAKGTGSHSYPHAKYGVQSANFGATEYRWPWMPNSLSGDNTDVATLLYHVGVSVEMNYSPTGSGASMDKAAGALGTYFGYGGGSYWDKQYHGFTDDAWKSILTASLNNGHPILYAGASAKSNGHAFVCDGYKYSDSFYYFHFNWGWGGEADGYFYLNALTPKPYGVPLDYSELQCAIVNISPNVADYPPTGYIDRGNCTSVQGWAKDEYNTEGPIAVDVYAADNPNGDNQVFLSRILANLDRADVGKHGFSYTVPESLKGGVVNTIIFYAINQPRGENPKIGYWQMCCGRSSEDLYPVYAFYSPYYKSHFHTISESEKDNLGKDIDGDERTKWNYEGIFWYAHKTAVEGAVPVYRFWDRNGDQNGQYYGHMFTASEEEKAMLMAEPDRWQYDGVGFYAYPASKPGTLPVHRFFSGEYTDHYFTIKQDVIVASSTCTSGKALKDQPSFCYEKVAWYAYPNLPVQQALLPAIRLLLNNKNKQ